MQAILKKLLSMFSQIILLLLPVYGDSIDHIMVQCQHNKKKCCQQLAQYYFVESNQTKEEWYRIQDLATRLCLKKDKCACFLLGNHYKSQIKNPVQAGIDQWKNKEIYLKKACELGEYRACNNLGVLYERKWWIKKYYPIQTNLTVALYYFYLACHSEDGVEKGCSNLKQVVGELKKVNKLHKSLQVIKARYGIDINLSTNDW